MEIYQRQAEEFVQLQIQAQARQRAERIRRFWETLRWGLEKNPLQRPENRPLHVLDLACGQCEEARTVGAYFSSGIPGMPTRAVRFFGIDKNPQAIHTAVLGSENGDPFYQSDAFYISLDSTFVCGDATHLEYYPELPEEIDFILVRHQFLIRAPEIFEQMLKKAFERLSSNGIVFFTSFSLMEHEALLKLVEYLGCEVLLAKKNPHALPIREPAPEGEVAFDQFVCVIRRP
jgi:hypothetical protein